VQRNQLAIARIGASPRGLFHQGQFRFHAAGGPGVAIRFERDGSKTTALTVSDPDLVVRARKNV
jgi:hypothetical protein